MISPASNPALFASAAPQTSGRSKLGKNEFMTLLVSQLRNQDPLSPLQPHEFAAQLAQFTTVEQLTLLNDQVEVQAQMSQLNALVGQTTFGASLVGRFVVAEGDRVEIAASGATTVRAEFTGAGRATLKLKDSAGRVVETRDLGDVAAGRKTLTLPSDLPAGSWRYEIEVKGPEGASVPVRTFTAGVVSGVHFKNGQIVLRIGALELSLDKLAEIEAQP